MTELKRAQDFTLLDQDGTSHTLSKYIGNWVVVYFYPRDDTPGCTREACNFRDGIHEFEKRKVRVLGISADSVQSHQKFAKKFKLNFPLLSDPEKKTIMEYEAWGKKSFMGKSYFGILRISYLINPEGEIVKKYEKVNPLTHFREILTDLDTLEKK